MTLEIWYVGISNIIIKNKLILLCPINVLDKKILFEEKHKTY